MSSGELDRLLSIDHLTPGDFKVVLERFLGLGFEKPSHAELLAELAMERMAKNDVPKTRIGFV